MNKEEFLSKSFISAYLELAFLQNSKQSTVIFPVLQTVLYAWPGFSSFCPPILIFLHIFILFSVFYQLLVRKREPGTFLMLLPSSSLQVLWQFSCTPVTHASISLYIHHPPTVCALFAYRFLQTVLQAPSSSSLRPQTNQKQLSGFVLTLCLPYHGVRQDVYLFKILGVQSYLILHLILLGNDTIWGLHSWFSFLCQYYWPETTDILTLLLLV